MQATRWRLSANLPIEAKSRSWRRHRADRPQLSSHNRSTHQLPRLRPTHQARRSRRRVPGGRRAVGKSDRRGNLLSSWVTAPICFPVRASQRRTIVSVLPVTRTAQSLSRPNAAEVTRFLCPLNESRMRSPGRASHGKSVRHHIPRPRQSDHRLFRAPDCVPV
jgi:hypothetical protein